MVHPLHYLWNRLFSIHPLDLALSRRGDVYNQERSFIVTLHCLATNAGVYEIGGNMSFCEVCECDPCDCYDGCEPERPVMKHAYIYDEQKEFYYVPRAPSLCEARTRASIFMKHFGDEPLIVNLQTWEMLSETFNVRFLEE